MMDTPVVAAAKRLKLLLDSGFLSPQLNLDLQLIVGPLLVTGGTVQATAKLGGAGSQRATSLLSRRLAAGRGSYMLRGASSVSISEFQLTRGAYNVAIADRITAEIKP